MKSKAYKSLLAVCLAAVLAALPGCGKKERTAQDMIEELVVDYGNYGEAATGRVAELLAELDAANPELGARWKKITDIWKTVNKNNTVNYGVLPDGLPDTDELCIVALGFQLEPDGTMRDELVERLKVVLASAQKYQRAYIVCTGGGTATENENATEAGEMAKWLVSNGIKEDRVIVENKSLTTAQNAICTYDILSDKYPGIKKIAIISSDYHIPTGTLLFKAEFILRADAAGEKYEVVSNAAYKAPSGTLSTVFQAGALIELSGDKETAFEIYYDNYDIHGLPPLN